MRLFYRRWRWRRDFPSAPHDRFSVLNFDLAIPRRGLRRFVMGPLKRFVDFQLLHPAPKRLCIFPNAFRPTHPRG
jgi:hypothetical protein